MYNAATAYKTAACLSCRANKFLKRTSLNGEVGDLAQSVFSACQNAVNWAKEGTYRSPYCAQSSFSREISRESAIMLLQKD